MSRRPQTDMALEGLRKRLEAKAKREAPRLAALRRKRQAEWQRQQVEQRTGRAERARAVGADYYQQNRERILAERAERRRLDPSLRERDREWHAARRQRDRDGTVTPLATAYSAQGGQQDV